MAFLSDKPDLRTRRVRDLVYDHLRKAIVQGELKADTYFTDVELAEEFGVSRTPIREAVQRLESAGYIERVPMRGNRVRGMSPRELAHSFGVRKALETLAVRYAAVRISAEGLESLEGLVARAEGACASLRGEERLAAVLPLIKGFNEIAFRAAGSEHLEALIWAERELFDRYGVMRIVVPDRLERSVGRRRELCAAFRARDAERAASIWASHIEESFAIWREKSGLSGELRDFALF